MPETVSFSISSIVAREGVVVAMARKAITAVINGKSGTVTVSYDENGVVTVSGTHSKNLKPAADDAEEAVEGTE